MMIDIGAGQNLILKNAVDPEITIDDKIVLKLTSINNSPLYTIEKFRGGGPASPWRVIGDNFI